MMERNGPAKEKGRVYFWVILVLGLLSLTLPVSPQERSAGKPGRNLNLLLITIDTLRADRLSCYSSVHLKTPSMDSLAARGMLFTRAFAHSSTTLPSHANILLGTTPLYHGVHDNANFVVREELITLAEHLKKFGYSTGAFVGAFPLDTRFGLSQGFDVYDDKYLQHTPEETAKERKAEVVVDKATEWLDQQGSAPWFLWIHCWDPHDPYTPPEPFATQYADSPYDGEVAYVDAVLGKLLRFMERAGLFSKTLVVFTGDHGESLGEHGEETHGFLAYNTTIWIPLIISLPGHKPGRINQPVSHVDIFPTVCEALQVEKPPFLQGTSLLPALKGKAFPKKPIYFESLSPFYSFGWAQMRGYIEGGGKFIDSPIPEFYDLDEDFDELVNLAEKKGVDGFRKRIAQIINSQEHQGSPGAERRMDRETLERLRSLGYVRSAQEKKKEEFGPEDDVKTLLPYYYRAAHALKLSNQGQVKEGMRLLKDIITENKFIPHAYTNLALVYKDLGRIKDALEVLRMGFEQMPENYDIFSGIIAFLMEDSQYDAVIEGVNSFPFREMDYDPVIWNYAGLAHWNKGNSGEAQGCWEKAVEIDAKLSTPYNNLGTLYFSDFRKSKDHKAYEMAAGNFKKAIELDPYNSRYHNGLGLLYLEAEAYGEAVSTLQRALDLDPGFHDVLFNLGMAHLKSRSFSLALDSLTKFKASPVYPSLSSTEKARLDGYIAQCRKGSDVR